MKANILIRGIVETPVANFIEANEQSRFDSEERFPECRMLADGLPNDAAAITYAVGQVAKAVFVPETEYDSGDLPAICRDAKEKAMHTDFRPYCDDDPIAGFEPNPEPAEEDFEEPGDGQEDGNAANGGCEPGDGVHEPADELPEDCVVGYGSGDVEGEFQKTKDGNRD